MVAACNSKIPLRFALARSCAHTASNTFLAWVRGVRWPSPRPTPAQTYPPDMSELAQKYAMQAAISEFCSEKAAVASIWCMRKLMLVSGVPAWVGLGSTPVSRCACSLYTISFSLYITCSSVQHCACCSVLGNLPSCSIVDAGPKPRPRCE